MPIADKISNGAAAADRLKSVDVSGDLAADQDSAGRVSERLARGTDDALSALREAGKTVGEGVSGVSRTAMDGANGVAASVGGVVVAGVPEVRAGASAISSQVCWFVPLARAFFFVFSFITLSPFSRDPGIL